MSRKPKFDSGAVIQRLVAVKLMIAGMKDAMPTTARELRREAAEAIDDLIDDVRAA